MGLAARRGALLLSLWALCQLFADTAGQLAEIKPITFSSWHYSAPSGVFNPAAVFNPQRGWVMMFRWDRCFYAHCGVLHTQTATLVSMTGKNPRQPDMNLAGANAVEWSFAQPSVRQLLAKNSANAVVLADFRPFNWKGQVYAGHWVKFGWEGDIVPADHQDCWVDFAGIFSCDYMAISKLNFETQQLEIVYHFTQSMLGTPYRSEKNWAFLEHGNKLIVFYSLLPCTVMYVFNPKAPKGAVYHSGYCYENHAEIQNATGLAIKDSHLSGNPVPFTPPNSTVQSELLGMVHARIGSFSYAHWALRMNLDTMAVTHVSSKPLVQSASYKQSGFLKEVLVIGSFHEIRLSDGQQVLRMLLGQGDQYSGYEDIPLANVQWVPMTKSVRVKNTEAVLDAMLETSREQNHKPHRRLAHNTPHSL